MTGESFHIVIEDAMTVRYDLHQHLWPAAFVDALAARARPPRLEGSGRRQTLRLAYEPDCAVDLAAHDVDARLALLDRDGIDVAVVSLSAALGVEALPARESVPLLEVYHDALLALCDAAGGRLAAFAAAPLDARDAGADAVARRLDAGCVGVSVPSEALATAAALVHLRPLLDLAEERGVPVFVHPGPAPWTVAAPADELLPAWWTPVAAYPASMLRAFFAWRAAGRDRHPALRIVFAVMAGGAPFLESRWQAFAGTAHPVDHGVFLDTAASARLALELALAAYGLDRVVYGSDTPVIASDGVRDALDGLGEPVARAVRETNPVHLLEPLGAPT
jgi:predicted TIM-barrel fold metal-dependent hydrolase